MNLSRKHRKLFYVPGMISLVVLPFLYLGYFYNHDVFKVENGMALGLPDKKSSQEIEEDYPFLLQRTYKEYTLNGSIESNKEQLADFHKELQRFNKVKDTVSGIKVHFTSQANYEVFIRILDLLAIEDTPTYMLKGDEFIIVNGAPSDIAQQQKKNEEKFGPPIQMNCGTQAAMERQRKWEEEEQRLETAEKERTEFSHRHWYLYMAYGGLILLNVYVLIKFNKNRIYNQKSYI